MLYLALEILRLQLDALSLLLAILELLGDRRFIHLVVCSLAADLFS